MLRRELRRLKDMTNINKVDQYTQTVEEQSIVNNAMVGFFLQYLRLFFKFFFSHTIYF